jgi:uncharacterized protein (TIGR03086 family)
MTTPVPSVDQLARVSAVVGDLVTGIRDDQWDAPTPCAHWSVRDLVTHLVTMNQVFAALLNDQTPPEHGADPLLDDPAAAYHTSAAAVQAAFNQPGILERSYQGPSGPTTGATRLLWRITDLLTHGWDLAQATGQPVQLPEDLADQALTFAEAQLATQPRAGRFGPAQTTANDAHATDRLAAFLGRHV